ncbi:glycosyltransferase [Hydrogenibacillus schlegelii]|uniref:Glycosyltransferase n=1 Tax=Hydrogenibacillus schlegelii TaxID=1484 RepID=A0A179IU57_HYDSH|nr:glycosyltransferase [Hydrogenibacillus schlegelii]MBT9282950.1 glycosyltransferase [Hydrogenibacillus schlegelii]OAR05459.1 hypothetical protein SA87_11240 [Hydrogenibacillus schlegelii]PTQ51943.1 MAG: UDP-N-acetylglucosamine--N-acetylmuramyl-(pentapeptide) pyrophosphoryl-undecaprenol N-acetylglucosamine transferase [Hydrogenibacillus schlegelii]
MEERIWRVLVFYSDYGDGHRHAAQAIAEGIRARDPAVDVVVHDFMRETHPFLHPLMQRAFLGALKFFPKVYRLAYRRTQEQTEAPLLDWLTSLGEKRLLEHVAKTKPDIVVSTHPFAARGMAHLVREGWVDVPAVTVITDHSDHRYWLAEGTSLYLVGSETLKRRLEELGVPESEVAATGIPVSLRFGEAPSRTAARAHLGLPAAQPVVMVMGGGFGLLHDALKLLRALQATGAEILLVAGRNERLKKEVERRVRRGRLRVRAYGYVERIERLMAAADVLVTKPGGLTTAEALALGLPMVLYSSLPGQEEDNARFLVSGGAAVRAETPEEAAAAVGALLASPERLAALRRAAAALGRPEAALEAADKILQLMRNPRSVPVRLRPRRSAAKTPVRPAAPWPAPEWPAPQLEGTPRFAH